MSQETGLSAAQDDFLRALARGALLRDVMGLLTLHGVSPSDPGFQGVVASVESLAVCVPPHEWIVVVQGVPFGAGSTPVAAVQDAWACVDESDEDEMDGYEVVAASPALARAVRAGMRDDTLRWSLCGGVACLASEAPPGAIVHGGRPGMHESGR